MPKNYMPSHLVRWLDSPHYAALRYRSMDESAIDAMYEFESWLDDSVDLPDDEMNKIKALIVEFLGNMDKIKAGEVEMLARWIKSVKGE